eukprot:TRINITY_DN20287_c1_g2_i1.p1 TRINITY_DN20287_c1_g2~~TRINITY_DN20287_c1_g2_i1.p1  ORF type:complete len:143 (-),score=18.35 TRINITY_DN20287_c1_g2_i1:34-462(-)
MLPNPDYQWKKQPLIQVWRRHSEDSKASLIKLELYGPNESTELFEEALRHNELEYHGKLVPLPFNFSILEWAAGTRQILNTAQLLNSISFYNIFGTSFETPFDVCYGSETSPLGNLSQICHTMCDAPESHIDYREESEWVYM